LPVHGSIDQHVAIGIDSPQWRRLPDTVASRDDVCTAADRHGRWKVGDVNIGGISMKDSRRQYFAQWIETNGGRFDALLAMLRREIAASRQGAI
jgi:hypothetical protein